MTCAPFNIGTMRGIVCGRPHKRKSLCACGRLATLLCDFPVGDETCDKPLCQVCAVKVGQNRDYCPKHPNRADPDADAFADIEVIAKPEEPA